MEAKKILSADFLDLLFDNRNKDYGAYELRVTYPQRVKRSLIVVFSLLAVIIAGVAFGNSFKPAKNEMITYRPLELEAIKPEEKKPEPIPKPPKVDRCKAARRGGFHRCNRSQEYGWR
jgi:protein TonB